MPTALLVIDIQRGALDGVRCPPIDSPERLVDHARQLVDAARAGKRPIVFIQHCERDPQAPFEEGSVHGQLHESLVPSGERDITLKKYASSAFENTDLDAQLKTRRIDELVICGLQSEFCVSNTTRSALALGYAVQLAQDGHSTWPSDGRSAAQIRDEVNASLGEAGANVAPTGLLVRTLSLG